MDSQDSMNDPEVFDFLEIYKALQDRIRKSGMTQAELEHLVQCYEQMFKQLREEN